ncbi:macro domain-containing protein [Actinomadura harenae]|uniref:Macro domain-containing protein n=1 Tax=Actinomadura harenae TaxID=2483351 RepID=A0A3M2LMZ4_9ACTN|nr:hypothetical protein [Actinomadura harenae]RMI38220.1 hypothetical protein EBO15_33650 [Actinomadura harenae]
MTDESLATDHEALLGDLRALRERGLLRLRDLRLPALRAAARGFDRSGHTGHAEIEALLRAALDQLDPGNLREAAAYTFGLAPGTRDWPSVARRRRSAELYGVTPEHFRKQQERDVIAQVAEQIELLRRPAPTGGTTPLPPISAVPFGDPSLPPLLLHLGPIELVSGVDILVSSENVHLEMAKSYGSSVSAALRRAGAVRKPSGEIVDDCLQRELTAWVSRHARPGLAVAPGTVAETGPGDLAGNGIRRVYHAAVVVAGPGGYDVSPDAIRLAVHNVFRLAERERTGFRPPLASICFPLFGTGRRSLLPVPVCAAALWRGIADELAGAPHWSVHVATHNPGHAAQVLETLAVNR